MRRFAERMGFTYVKLGQFLALRFDVLPAEVCAELRKLFDRAPPMGFAKVEGQLRREFGGPVPEFFASVDSNCLAAASLAQVHLACTRDGEQVVVKVQRPEARDDFEADMWMARHMARWIDSIGVLRALSLTSLLGEFEDFTRRELDFVTEARVATRLRSRVNPGVRVPRVRWDLTTRSVLTLEYVDGVSLSTTIDLLKRGRHDELTCLLPGVDMTDVIRRITLESLRQVLVDGLFHADPHPGNILVCADGTVTYVDFGMFGQLTPRQRLHCAGYIEQAAIRNYERSFLHFFQLVTTTPDLDYPAFKRDMTNLMRGWAEWSNAPSSQLYERHLGAVMQRTLATMRLNGVRPDSDLLLFWRVVFVLDSIALDVSDQFDLIAVMRDFFASEMNSARSQLRRLVDGTLPSMSAPRRSLAFATRHAAGMTSVDRYSARRAALRPSRLDRWRRVVLIDLAITILPIAILIR
jgi:ubiquinone biosynthesis protein